jgi:hypothetical protein
VKIYFSDFFAVDPAILSSYGALDISLVNDLPLFVDPFLLFNSQKPEYQKLHNEIIRYVKFLRDKSVAGDLSEGLIGAWFYFPEVKQSWLGYSESGNSGRGLGKKFADALHENLTTVFRTFGEEKIASGSHIEKLCLLRRGIGRDNISDFATNLIKRFLLEYTQTFALQYLRSELLGKVYVTKTSFNYHTETWETCDFVLPIFNDGVRSDFVLLTPEDMLTKDETWINSQDLLRRYDHIANSIPNEDIRAQINNYFHSVMPRPTIDPKTDKPAEPTQVEVNGAILQVLAKFPQVVEYYIKEKEEQGDEASTVSAERVDDTKKLFIEQVRTLADSLAKAGFYSVGLDSYDEAMKRVMFVKDVVENQDGYRFFYVKGKPVQRELDVQLIYRLTWFASPMDVNREPNNGRGPVDYSVSIGASNKSLVEFKLASNSKLKQNLANQVKIYEAANNTRKSIKVIFFFSQAEHEHLKGVLQDLGLQHDKSVVLIDARDDNKESASNVKSDTSTQEN